MMDLAKFELALGIGNAVDTAVLFPLGILGILCFFNNPILLLASIITGGYGLIGLISLSEAFKVFKKLYL